VIQGWLNKGIQIDFKENIWNRKRRRIRTNKEIEDTLKGKVLQNL